jgi:hypothetical protein
LSSGGGAKKLSAISYQRLAIMKNLMAESRQPESESKLLSRASSNWRAARQSVGFFRRRLALLGGHRSA